MTGTTRHWAGLTSMRMSVICLPVLVLLAAGCGVYTFNPAGKSDLKSIAIIPFENQTDQYELTDRLTEIVIDAFISDGSLKVVGESNADALLEGTLTHYSRVPHEFDESEVVQQYRVVMTVRATLKKPSDDSEIWNETFNLEGTYDAVDGTEEDGQQEAGVQLVEHVLNKATKSW